MRARVLEQRLGPVVPVVPVEDAESGDDSGK
jgi:hypothetical protein